ncbi:MAG: hypothetical protein Q8N23_20120 [Archangium sp.]|nr:hypothetical protein [Archangium sp.]MDP3154996.1 hypothetical protein [Archangium sp.]MDP3574424.1 hypothetical protein [Archangium sp.]
MSALLTHLTAVERLAAHVNALPSEFARALGEDLEYARFGAALPELPRFGGWIQGVDTWLARGHRPHFTELMAARSPVHFGLKAAELVSNGALIGVDAGLAWLAGYFTQLCVSRALEPVIQRLLTTQRQQGEPETTARARIEWTQSLFFMQDLHGSSLVGTPAVRAKLQIRKASSVKGIGRGFYELIRVASLDAFGQAPSKTEVDGWVRGLYMFSLALGSPLGRLRALPTGHLSTRELYRGDGFDVFATVDVGLERARELLTVLGGMIRRNSWTARSRGRFLELCPEGAPSQVVMTRLLQGPDSPIASGT